MRSFYIPIVLTDLSITSCNFSTILCVVVLLGPPSRGSSIPQWKLKEKSYQTHLRSVNEIVFKTNFIIVRHSSFYFKQHTRTETALILVSTTNRWVEFFPIHTTSIVSCVNLRKENILRATSRTFQSTLLFSYTILVHYNKIIYLHQSEECWIYGEQHYNSPKYIRIKILTYWMKLMVNRNYYRFTIAKIFNLNHKLKS